MVGTCVPRSHPPGWTRCPSALTTPGSFPFWRTGRCSRVWTICGAPANSSWYGRDLYEVGRHKHVAKFVSGERSRFSSPVLNFDTWHAGTRGIPEVYTVVRTVHTVIKRACLRKRRLTLPPLPHQRPLLKRCLFFPNLVQYQSQCPRMQSKTCKNNNTCVW